MSSFHLRNTQANCQAFIIRIDTVIQPHLHKIHRPTNNDTAQKQYEILQFMCCSMPLNLIIQNKIEHNSLRLHGPTHKCLCVYNLPLSPPPPLSVLPSSRLFVRSCTCNKSHQIGIDNSVHEYTCMNLNHFHFIAQWKNSCYINWSQFYTLPRPESLIQIVRQYQIRTHQTEYYTMALRQLEKAVLV